MRHRTAGRARVCEHEGEPGNDGEREGRAHDEDDRIDPDAAVELELTSDADGEQR